MDRLERIAQRLYLVLPALAARGAELVGLGRYRRAPRETAARPVAPPSQPSQGQLVLKYKTAVSYLWTCGTWRGCLQALRRARRVAAARMKSPDRMATDAPGPTAALEKSRSTGRRPSIRRPGRPHATAATRHPLARMGIGTGKQRFSTKCMRTQPPLCRSRPIRYCGPAGNRTARRLPGGRLAPRAAPSVLSKPVFFAVWLFSSLCRLETFAIRCEILGCGRAPTPRRAIDRGPDTGGKA